VVFSLGVLSAGLIFDLLFSCSPGFGHRYQVIVFDSAAGTQSDSSSVLRFSFWSQNSPLSVFGSSTGAAWLPVFRPAL
jgi:hypothetical protein